LQIIYRIVSYVEAVALMMRDKDN